MVKGKPGSLLHGTQQLLNRARTLAHQYTAKLRFTNAAYWAEKAHCLSQGDPNDLALYAQALCLCREHRRACHVLQSSPYLHQSAPLRYLAAK